MSYVFNGRGTVLIKGKSVKGIAEQFVKLMALYDGINIDAIDNDDVVAYVQEIKSNFKLDGRFDIKQEGDEKWVFQFENHARHGFVSDVQKLIEENLEMIYEGKLWFSCNDEDGWDDGFPFIRYFEIVDGKVYDQVLETRLPYDWDLYHNCDSAYENACKRGWVKEKTVKGYTWVKKKDDDTVTQPS